MQTVTYEMAKGAAQLNPVACSVLHEFDEIPALLMGNWEDGAHVVRAEDFKPCNWPVPFERIRVSDEDAARCLQAYRNARREVEKAEAFVQEQAPAQPTSRRIGGDEDYIAPPRPRPELTHRYYSGNSYGARAFRGRRGR